MTRRVCALVTIACPWITIVDLRRRLHHAERMHMAAIRVGARYLERAEHAETRLTEFVAAEQAHETQTGWSL